MAAAMNTFISGEAQGEICFLWNDTGLLTLESWNATCTIQNENYQLQLPSVTFQVRHNGGIC
jgi:hypothetical protein